MLRRPLLLLGLLALGLSTVSAALSTSAGEVDYYSDPTFQNMVGYWIHDCQGHNIRDGNTSTAYWKWSVADEYACGSTYPCRAGSHDVALYDIDNEIVTTGCISDATCRDAGNFCQPNPAPTTGQSCYHCVVPTH